MRPFAVAGASLACLALAAAPAAAQSDEELRQALTQQDIMPMAEAMSIVQQAYVGPIVEAELTEEDDAASGWAYEFELLTGANRIDIEVDAVSGEIVDVDE